MERLPEGTVTVLFSDIEGSTGLVSSLGEHWGEALSMQRATLRAVFAAHKGHEMGTEGDSFFIVFDSAHDAVLAAVEGQRRLQDQRWPEGTEVRVRMGLHTGEPQRHEDGYIGLDVHRGARIAGTAHGSQVVLSDATRSLVDDLFPASGEVAARDLGWHRLKDLASPEHLHDLVVAGLVSTFPPLRSLGTEVNLPRPATELVGRDDEVNRLEQMFTHDDVRLATVTGPGGTGKTRVALAAATRLAGTQPAVFFVRLSGATDAQTMWAGIADTLGAGGSSSVSQRERVIHLLAARPTLLVLDNLEQIPDADGVVALLLTDCPGLRLLATSRRPLHLVAEYELPLAPMTVPSTGADVATAERSDAVRLFCQRATMVRPAFTLTEANVGDVIAVCQRLDGLPLALELAAARLRLLSPRGLLDHLDDNLGAGPGWRDRPERQRTLHNTIAWSHDLLTPEDRVVFRRLGAFVGGVGIDAVEEVAGLGDVEPLDPVARLVDASLVRVRDRHDGEPQLWMLQTVRAFAREQLLESGEADQVLDRHVAWCAALTDELVAMLKGPAPLVAIDAIDEALPDVRAALSRTMTPGRPERHDAAARIMAGMSWYWYRYRFADEWRMWNDRLREATGGVDSVALIQSLHGASLGMLQDGEVGPAVELLEQAVGVAQRLGDRSLEARGLNSLGVALLEAGDREASRARLEASLDIARDIDEPSRQATVLSNLAVLLIEDGDYQAGLDTAAKAIEFDRGNGDIWSVTLNEINMTPAVTHIHGVRAAHAHLCDVAGRVADAGDNDLMADLLDHHVHVLARAGAHRRAARLAGAVLAYRKARSLPRQSVERRLVEAAEEWGRAAIGSTSWDEEFGAGELLDEAATMRLAAEPLPDDASVAAGQYG